MISLLRILSSTKLLQHCWPLSSWWYHISISFYCVTGGFYLSIPFTYFTSLTHSPSGNHLFFLYESVFIFLNFFMDSTYHWDHIVFVFLCFWLILFNIISITQTRRGLTLLSQPCRDPAVAVRNGDEAWGSCLPSRWGPLPLRQTQRSPEGPRHLHRIPRLSEAPWEVP